ncbi:hypothetical protein LOD99_4470 [Oopsacas minuta]|uniref:Uncharacterized protein n=1 Tax=Oopsacas minuta TaxID=111878 RepID=A0AAV7JV46_9METZ|nr:hypothetical protein LOD99_4470 [Oopsacas minuta]
MKQLIDMKSEEVLKELDSIWEEVNQRKEKKRQEIEKNIEEINEAKKALEKLFLKLDPNSISLPQISERIESVKKDMDISIPTVVVAYTDCVAVTNRVY